MKKYVSILLAAVMLISILAFSGCTKSTTEDVEYIRQKGTLVVGVIDAPPLTVLNDEGEWSGFAADLLRSFGKKLGVDVEFKEIDWDEMEHLLNDKTIELSDRRHQGGQCPQVHVRGRLPADQDRRPRRFHPRRSGERQRLHHSGKRLYGRRSESGL